VARAAACKSPCAKVCDNNLYQIEVRGGYVGNPNLKGIAISVGSAVILAALTWMGLRFSERGQLSRKNLGTFELTEALSQELVAEA
jgi:hypothetical protein